MVCADVFGRRARVFEVYRVRAHADGEGAYRLFALFRGYRADEGGVESAGKQEADLRVGDEAFLDAGD